MTMDHDDDRRASVGVIPTSANLKTLLTDHRTGLDGNVGVTVTANPFGNRVAGTGSRITRLRRGAQPLWWQGTHASGLKRTLEEGDWAGFLVELRHVATLAPHEFVPAAIHENEACKLSIAALSTAQSGSSHSSACFSGCRRCTDWTADRLTGTPGRYVSTRTTVVRVKVKWSAGPGRSSLFGTEWEGSGFCLWDRRARCRFAPPGHARSHLPRHLAWRLA